VALTADQIKSGTVQNEETDFESLFREQWPRVYAVLYRLVGEGEEAQDLALEAFWRLHHRRPTQAVGAELRGWLYRVATNLGINALRSRKRRQRYEERAASLDLSQSAAAGPEAEIERWQERQRVRLALSRLKERSAQMLVLRHSGFSYSEIAAALDIAPASVGTLLARAEKEFEAQYRKMEP
jgi:RNA polymerase sigma-70 factor (ECF subfamily)